MQEMPELIFSKWYPWCKREDINNIRYPGVYAIAISTAKLEGNEVDYQDIVYIGMSNSQAGIFGRLSNFDGAINGGSGHSGGETTYEDLGAYSTWENLKLFVAAMHIECYPSRRNVCDLIGMGQVAYLEYMAFAKYKQYTNNYRPKYNTK